jgi:hypothetical protein
MQLLWIIVGGAAVRLIWRQGVRAFTAVGN